MKTDYDIAIIGAGLLGCFTARNLTKHNWKVAVFEKNCDVCTEVSKANTAIIYPGYDPKPGSLKARLCLDANKKFNTLCESLGVRFNRLGSLMVSYGENADSVLLSKYNQGLSNGVKGLRILEKQEVINFEPNINKAVRGALYSPETSTLLPWELGIAGAENASNNGAEFYFNSEVTGIKREGNKYRLHVGAKSFSAKAVVNCAGLYGDSVSEMINNPSFKIETTAADYLLLDNKANGHVKNIIMYEPEEKGRRISIVPTVEGNILLGPSRIKNKTKEAFATTQEGCSFVKEVSEFVFPNIPMDFLIRSFASIRPSLSIIAQDDAGNFVETGERIQDILIFETENPGFINLAGIRTPGLTCCDEIGLHVSEMLLDILGNPGKNADFSDEVEKKIRFHDLSPDEQAELIKTNSENGKIVCRCGHITEAEIRNSIRHAIGAKTLDGVKRRAGAQMGRCQGGFCTQRIIEILADELSVDISKVQKDGFGSELIGLNNPN